MRWTWRKSSSTGVSRPKNDTSTRTLPFSGLMSSTTPMKSVNGPSTTLTRSPLVKLTLTLGFLADLLEDLFDFVVLQWRRPRGCADEAGHPGRIAHDVPGIVVHG